MRIVIGLILIAGLIAAALFFTDERRSEIREITATAATSDCIGDPKTPACAAETWLACEVRLDSELCRTAFYGRDHGRCLENPDLPDCTLDFNVGEERDGDALYRIIAVRSPTPAERSEHAFRPLPSPELVVEGERWICPLPGEARKDGAAHAALPIAAPQGGFLAWLQAQGRRLQTVAWEWGLLEEPFPWVWYGAGTDYCWEPLRYWVGQKDGDWRVVKWPTIGYEDCPLSCGCPEMHWPRYRKIAVCAN